jgi:uncharacterized protein (TIGR04255 family)
MAVKINEVFPNPVLKQVFFEIKFPNLFYIESKIGDFQLKIIEKFPQSSLLIRRQIVFADLGPEIKPEQITDSNEDSLGKKVWQFKSDDAEINLTSNSLVFTTTKLKTYNEQTDQKKIRDLIKYTIEKFFEVIEIPLIERLGLRYINECPIPIKDNENFNLWYKSVFPTKRFKLEDSEEMYSRSNTKFGDYRLIYQEALQKIDEVYKFIIDIDSSIQNIPVTDCLAKTDELHKLIKKEFCNSVKEPLINHMKTPLN